MRRHVVGHGWRRRCAAVLAALLGAPALAVLGTPGVARAATTDPVAIGVGNGTDKRVLQVASTANGAAVTASTYRTAINGTNVDDQRWTLDLSVIVDEEITPVYEIRNVQSGKCLTKATANTNGAAVSIQPCTDALTQMWTVPWGGAYTGTPLQSLADYRCLNIANGSTANGAAVRVNTCIDDWGATDWYQRWRLKYGTFDCDRYSNQRLLTGLCVSSGSEPMYGLFGTFNNRAVQFGPEAAELPSTTANFFEVASINAQLADSTDDGVEFGLMTSFDPEAGTQGYLPYWTEWGNGTEETHPITNTPYGTLPDNRQHHYVLATTTGGSKQYDVLYDYNPVGTTRLQEGGRYRDAFAMTTVQNPNTVTFPTAFENRLQMQNGNGIYFKPGTGQVSRSEPKTCGALPTDVDPLWDEINVAPWCLTTSLGVTGNEVQYMRVSKPNTSLARAPVVAAPAPSSAPAVVNGVDQAELRDCVAQGASLCFDQVPGLRACVDARLVCNAAAAAVGGVTAGQITGGQAEERVAARLRPTDRTKISSAAKRASDLPPALRAKLPATLATTAPVAVVTGHGEVHGLSAGKDRVYQGHLTVLDGATGALVYACLGRECPTAQ